MGEIAIRVDNISKQYRIGPRERYKALRDVITDSFTAPYRWLTRRTVGAGTPLNEDQFWALRDVSFEVKRGEVIGVIGRNGAGKSTLLKVLSRITEPTEGHAEIHGRVGSLLEVGTGFHPELTGRENVYLNGAILGMKRVEIGRKFDEIVAFAEVEKFIDTPVKHYSSGMQMRLAFAVAAHLEPEILLVDEVLAVGDAAFQKKCLGKMGEVSQQGRTILFVSHNMTALQSLCEKAIWLDGGRVAEVGDSKSVVAHYLQTNAESVLEREWPDPATAPGNDKVRLHRFSISPDTVEPVSQITVRTPIRVAFEYWNFVAETVLNLSLTLYTLEGICVLNTVSVPTKTLAGLIRCVCHIPAQFLNDGTYDLSVLVVKDTSTILLNLDHFVAFEVRDVERQYNWYGKWQGVVRPIFDWQTEWLESMGGVESGGLQTTQAINHPAYQ
jgi:lipopolysaccharide transport system ATP-binding protein